MYIYLGAYILYIACVVYGFRILKRCPSILFFHLSAKEYGLFGLAFAAFNFQKLTGHKVMLEQISQFHLRNVHCSTLHKRTFFLFVFRDKRLVQFVQNDIKEA